MAIITNTLTTFAAIGNREDLADTIYNISPTDCPFMTAIGQNKASAVLHEWQIDSLADAAANAAVEGDDTTSTYTFATVTPTTRINNRCQISRKDVVVSGTQDAVNKAGRKKEMVYQLVKRQKELRRDMEFILTNNQAPVTGSSSVARQLRPLVGWYATNTSADSGAVNGTTALARTDGTQRPLTESMIKTVFQGAWSKGGDPDLVLSGPFNKTVISTFTGNNTRTQDTTKGKLVSSIDLYVSDFGTHKIVADRFSRDRDLHILTTDLWAVSYLRSPQTIDLAKTGDNEKAQIIVEYTLESRNEAGSGLVSDLTTA